LGAGGTRLPARFRGVVFFGATLVFGADGTFVDAALVRGATAVMSIPFKLTSMRMPLARSRHH
jgi:hypothetical protein